MLKSGGNMNIKSLPEVMSQNAGNSYTLRNKRGGFSDSSPKEAVGLDYSTIKYQGNNNGDYIDRTVTSQDIPNRLLASEQVSALPLIQKYTAFGTPSDVMLPFSYFSNKVSITGGSKKCKQNRKK